MKKVYEIIKFRFLLLLCCVVQYTHECKKVKSNNYQLIL